MRSGGLLLRTAVRNCCSSSPPSVQLSVTPLYLLLNSAIRFLAMSSPFVQSKPITLSVPLASMATGPDDPEAGLAEASADAAPDAPAEPDASVEADAAALGAAALAALLAAPLPCAPV